METDIQGRDQAAPDSNKTEFAKRNPYLEKLVPDAIENAVDVLIPDKVGKVSVILAHMPGTSASTPAVPPGVTA